MLKLDPRVKTSAAGLAQLAGATRETYDAAVAAHAAHEQARALVGQLARLTGEDVVAFRAQVEALAPGAATGRRGRGFGGPGGPGGAGAVPAPTLESVSNAMMAAAMAMQGADVAPTAGQIATAAKARAEGAATLRSWTALRTTGLAALNAKRRAAGQPPVAIPGS
jgi:hypothetical protein